MSAAFSILRLIPVLLPLPILAVQVVGAVLLARRLPPGSRRSLGVAAFSVGALATLVWLTSNVAVQLIPRLRDEYELGYTQISVVLDLLNWVGGIVGAVAVLLVLLAMFARSARAEHRTW